jgi:ring-1,2-phenylacetyl-CoA epoxidase subunit PaaD
VVSQSTLEELDLVSASPLDKAQTGSWIERLQHRQQSVYQSIWNLLDEVKDPEIPIVSIWDLGILCDISLEADQYHISITPTYSGCPAMDTIRVDVLEALSKAGIDNVDVKMKLAPAWTTDSMSPLGRQQLLEYGIAPPENKIVGCALTPEQGIRCPRCGSEQTERISEFASTACKALFKCSQCLEPFDYFKQI